MDCFEILADPTRRRMLARLARRPHAVGELVAAFPSLTQPAISRHLRVLREAGFVDVRTDAQRRIYALREDCFAPLTDWLEGCRAQRTELSGISRSNEGAVMGDSTSAQPMRNARRQGPTQRTQ